MPEQVYLPMIGVDKLYHGRVLTDTALGITGEVPKAIPGLTEVGFNTNAKLASFFADNGSYEVAGTNGELDGGIAIADVPPYLAAELFGDSYDETTGELLGGEINPPYEFIQYRVKKSSGAYRYVTIFKIKCVPNADKVNTTGGSINFQTNGFAFKAVNTLFSGDFKRTLDDDDPNLPEGVTPEIIADNWFTDIFWAIEAVAVSGVALNKAVLNKTVGQYETLIATVSPADASNKEGIWTSTDTSVATVNQTGRVTAVAAGTATITFTN